MLCFRFLLGGLVDLYLIDRYALSGTENAVVGVASLFPLCWNEDLQMTFQL